MATTDRHKLLILLLIAVSTCIPPIPGTEDYIFVSVDAATVIGHQLRSGGIYRYPGDGGSINSASPSPPLTDPGLSDVRITSMDVNIANGFVYFFNKPSRCIYRLKLDNDTNVDRVHCGISSSVYSSIAYDWISGNMYWTDGFFNWIAVQPVDTPDRSMYRIVVQDDIEKPRAMAVDPIAGYIFWFDISPSGYRIERAFPDGKGRSHIITTGLLAVQDIETDAASRRLYWTDADRYSVGSADYDGTDRKILYRELNILFRSITIDTDHVCATIFDRNLWVCFAKTDGSLAFVRRTEFSVTTPNIIAMYKDTLQPSTTDNCTSMGCQHFYVYRPTGCICMCKEGYTLNADDKQCTAKHQLYDKGIAVCNATTIGMLDFRAPIGHSDPILYRSNVVQGCAFLAADTVNQVMFYVDTVSNNIKEYNMVTNTGRDITTATGVSGLTYDWTDGNLYWSESTGKVKMVSITTFAVSEVAEASSPSDVTIDSHSRTLFWIEGTSGLTMRIRSKSLTTTGNSVVLKETSSASMKGLFFDVSSDRLYYVDSSTLYSINRSGSDLTNYQNNFISLEKLIIHKRYSVWSDADSSTLKSNSLQQSSLQTIQLDPNFGTVTGMAVYDPALQRSTKGPCRHLNGGCEQICLSGLTGTAICACSYGFDRQPDGKSCGSADIASEGSIDLYPINTSVPQTDNFILVPDLTHGRLYQVSMANAQVTALDINVIDRPLDALYDSKSSLLYWTDITDGHIMRSTLTGTDVTTIFTSFGDSTYAAVLAMDESTGNLYYTVKGDPNTSTPGSVGVIQPSTRLSKTLVDNLGAVHGLALYPSKGIMFYINQHDSNSYIAKASMDGSNVHTIATFNTTNVPKDLAIHYTTDRLYWTSNTGVEYSDMYGSNRGTFFTRRALAIQIDRNYIYLTSDKIHKILKMDIYTKQDVPYMAENAEIGIMLEIFAYPGQTQPVSTVCSTHNGQCSTFCLPNALSASCECPDGIDLKSDDPTTCKGVIRCPWVIRNGKFGDTCQHIGSEVCTFECDQGYIRSTPATSLTCQQNGQWDEDSDNICTVTTEEEIPAQNLTLIYIGAGLGALVVIAVTIICVVWALKRRRGVPGQTSGRGEPNVYYTPNQQLRMFPTDMNSSIQSPIYQPRPSNQAHDYPEKPPAYSPPYQQETIYDEIPAAGQPAQNSQNIVPTSPDTYDEPSVRARSPSVVSVHDHDSDYLTLISKQ